MREIYAARDATCFEFLRAVRDLNLVLVGGYAVSAFDLPRFSVDLDIVVPSDSLADFESRLASLSYERFSEWRSEEVETRTLRYEKRVMGLPSRVDLLVDGMRVRQTGVSYSWSYLSDNSERRTAVGYAPESSVEVTVPTREMLIALKLSAGRQADMRDLVALAVGEIDPAEVARHLQEAASDVLLRHLESLEQSLSDDHFRSSFQSVFGMGERDASGIFERGGRFVAALRRTLTDSVGPS